MSVETLKELKAYRLVEDEKLAEVNGHGFVLEHLKTKARVLIIENDDTNKVFTIGFRTPPKDSTGTPHIIEHTVLCGSKKYPVKDPFVELCKGSLNTFLNAMTYSDKTVYPVASCNDKDFANLVDVYMDAVFNPNIYEKEEIFMQEGWHYEMTEPDGEITINGVVYNEMKGVYSSPDSVMYRAVEKSVYPDTCYVKDSGGYPEDIPTLTREAYLDFHRTFYHPSNSYIYLYGNCDMAEMLEKLDSDYLSEYEYKAIDSKIEPQPLFDAPIEYREEYSLSEAEELTDNTYLGYNVLCGMGTDKKLVTAFDILEYVLVQAPGAPVKKAIIDAEICSDVESAYDTTAIQPIFSIIAHNSNEEDKEKFISLIDDTLKKVVAEGLNKKTLLAAIVKAEFKHKEGNYGRYPKGLMLGLDAFETWLYDDTKALELFSMNEVFEELKNEIDTGYFEGLIEKYLINNTHKAYIVLSPKHGLSEERDNKLREKLAEYKNSLSKEEIDELIAKTKHLKEYQSEPSPQEDLLKIPLLEVSDIDKAAKKLKNEVTEIENVKVVKHNIFTNGISYLELHFNTDDLDNEMIKTASLLTEILKYVDTDSHTYDELAAEINLIAGGIGFSTGVSYNHKNEKAFSYFNAKLKMFDENIDAAMKLVEEILFTSHITDKKRLKEIIAEAKSNIKQDLVSSGHLTSSQRALSYISETYMIKECIDGIEYYNYIDKLDTDFENQYDKLCEDLQTVISMILRRGALTVSYISDKDTETMLKAPIERFSRLLSSRYQFEKKEEFSVDKKNEAFKTAGQVQFNAIAGNYKDAGYEYDSALNVLQVIFSYEYLWLNVRVKGGAYGCMCNFPKSGYSYLTSYRDPNLVETYDIYKKAFEYVESFDCDDRDMTKYIIGAISKMDAPLTPSAEGAFSFVCYLAGVTDEDLQKDRDGVLSCNQEKIRGLAPYIKTITDSEAVCTIGNQKKIEEVKDMFKNERFI